MALSLEEWRAVEWFSAMKWWNLIHLIDRSLIYLCWFERPLPLYSGELGTWASSSPEQAAQKAQAYVSASSGIDQNWKSECDEPFEAIAANTYWALVLDRTLCRSWSNRMTDSVLRAAYKYSEDVISRPLFQERHLDYNLTETSPLFRTRINEIKYTSLFKIIIKVFISVVVTKWTPLGKDFTAVPSLTPSSLPHLFKRKYTYILFWTLKSL